MPRGEVAEVSDHFRTVGFTLERDELSSLLQRAIDAGTLIEAPHGDYRVWAPGAGAELWVNLYRRDGNTRELAGVNPHFSGDARMSAIVEAIEPNAEFFTGRRDLCVGILRAATNTASTRFQQASRISTRRSARVTCRFAPTLPSPDSRTNCAGGPTAMRTPRRCATNPPDSPPPRSCRSAVRQQHGTRALAGRRHRHDPRERTALQPRNGTAVPAAAARNVRRPDRHPCRARASSTGDPEPGGVARATCWLTARIVD